ncbi:MAG: 4-(cytidine 5'-diphospho)-2-C-methyl-D-erythritol kinase [Ilumatobacteraceae bacterium]
MSDIATLAAHAKLTLSLRVTGVRADGYHLIDAEMISLQLADTLRIDPQGWGITVAGPFAQGVPTTGDNLVARALALAGRSAGVHIDKQIPNGGGLGGGSSDAAAVLRWAGFNDLVAASRLGADIPFCIVGSRARVGGIGEVVVPLTENDRRDEPIDITLVIPPLHVSTPEVYKAWDSLDETSRRGEVNDLEPAAIVVQPALARWRDRIREASGQSPVLAGSGATWFLRGRHEVADALSDATVIVTRSL